MSARYQIEKLLLPPELHDSYSVATTAGGDPKILLGLSQINLFVGANNSGKSRLLRRIFATQAHKFLPYRFPKEITTCAQFVKKRLSQVGGENVVVSPFQKLATELPTFDLVQENTSTVGPLSDIIAQARAVRGPDLSISATGMHPPNGNEITKNIRNTGNEAATILGTAANEIQEKYSFERLYIPTLRGLRPFRGIGHDIYTERTNQDYFGGTPQGLVFSGLTFYQELQNMLLGERAQRDAARRFEDFLSTALFQGNPITLVPRKGSDVVYVRLGNEREFPIHELGDGIQHLIVLTFPLYRSQNKPTLIFIEEPELFLHPSMQRSLVKAMRTFDNYQYFIATHSNHLLDLTLEFDEISIYMVHKAMADATADESVAHFTIEPASTHDHRILNLLGSRVSSVFLSNCTIWVEGITDRRYLRHFLELYFKYLDTIPLAAGERRFVPKQDFHYSFVEYSGGNITHWSFLEKTDDPIEVERLCAKLMLIADRDESKSKDERHSQLAAKLKERFVRLDCREVENLLTPELLKLVLLDYGEDEAEIASFEQNNYATEALGNFLESTISKIKRVGGYAADSGTLKNKVDFCAKAITHMQSFSDLSLEARGLTERVYKFIKDHNS